MVGEIRDEETADIAVRTALVGRLLLSSIHTNDAVSVIPRLLDMGIEPYLVGSTLSLVIAQRLARKLCVYCRQSYKPDATTLKQLDANRHLTDSLKRLKKLGVMDAADLTELRLFKAVGCEKCNRTGYSGRTGLYEVLEISDEFRSHISHENDSRKLQEVAIANGMKTMFDDGLAKATLGIIDIDELVRVTYS